MAKFEKGQPRHPDAGRKVGSQNKLTLMVTTRLEELGCDPIEGMVIIAQDLEVPIDLRLKAFSELAQYAYPKRKAIDHTITGGLILDHTNAAAVLRSRIDRIAARRGEGSGLSGPDGKPS